MTDSRANDCGGDMASQSTDGKADTVDLPAVALSVRQPWAWAVIHGGKDVENRVARAVTMGGMKPGRIAVHASKGMTRSEYEVAAEFMRRLGVPCPRPDDLVRGAIIGSVTVTEIVKDHESPWFFGPRGLVLADPRPCLPIPASGQLGFFPWRAAGAGETLRAWPDDHRRTVQPVAANDVKRFKTPCDLPDARQREILNILIEEAAEVQQRATKALRFGLAEVQPGQDLSNRQRLALELGDLDEVVSLAVDEQLIDSRDIRDGALRKREKLAVYMQTDPASD